jgi:transcriptional regulator with XRE-family HTH domain
MDLYEKIKFVRESSKLNQKEFADRINVTQSTVSKYEKNERTPDFYAIKSLFENFNVNPNWIFFDFEPAFLNVDDNNISIQNQELIRDIDMILTPEDLNAKLNDILFDYTIEQIISDNDQEKSAIRIFLEAIRLDGHIPFRPLLFLYYIFRYVKDNKDEVAKINSYKEYILDLVKRYNVLTFKNSPAFTSQIKRQIEASIEIHLAEADCKRLLTHYEEVLKKIESKMTSMIVKAHKKIDTKTLFPK